MASISDANIFRRPAQKSSEIAEPITHFAKSVIDVENLYYNLNDGRIKKAIIFNHFTFKQIGLHKPADRTGTDVDCKRIIKCLKNLGFEIDLHDDPKRDEIEQTIKRASGLKNTEVSCIVVVVMTHGESNNVLYANNTIYPVCRLTDPFLRDSCELTGVPKIFFIQACRGEKVDEGKIVFDGNVDGDKTTHRIPSHADFLIMYSTMPDHISWREGRDGTWFIQSLCEQLEDNYQQWDLLHLLTFVNYRVAYCFASNTYDEADKKSIVYHNKKQMPQFESTLTKILKFSAKRENI